jgi:hypothetical protein
LVRIESPQVKVIKVHQFVSSSNSLANSIFFAIRTCLELGSSSLFLVAQIIWGLASPTVDRITEERG